ncbi:unnamed protein product [Pleuronectes platessa]|uniref:Uncharacterized protein n=1 Tax=Pleuronectes platessa TaxID=8262 RepID=A0A9N7UAA5_PLEPL|nr:unnamed protein product [Pleuronectes platessa]
MPHGKFAFSNTHTDKRYVPTINIKSFFDLAKDGAIEEWSGNLQEYKRLLPLGNDILNNNKAPLTSIVELIPEEVVMRSSNLSASWLGVCSVEGEGGARG